MNIDTTLADHKCADCTISVRMRERSDLEWLDRVAKRTNTSRAEVLRAVITAARNDDEARNAQA